MKGKYMTVPQLKHYLAVNGDFPEANLAQVVAAWTPAISFLLLGLVLLYLGSTNRPIPFTG
jgi:hypothetical protein